MKIRCAPAWILPFLLLVFGPTGAEGFHNNLDNPSPLNPSNPEPAEVIQLTNQLKFSPDTVTITVGQTIKWKNTSVLVHTVTGDPERATMKKSVKLPDGASPFDSGDLQPKETFKHTFKTPGTYRYFCVPHEAMMRGTVIVKPAD